MVTVNSKSGLTQALRNRESSIIVAGELAKEMRRKNKARKVTIAGSLAVAAIGLVAAPFTGGASLGATTASVMGITASAGSAALTMSAGELAILCGTGIALTGLCIGAETEFFSDGRVRVTPKYKK